MTMFRHSFLYRSCHGNAVCHDTLSIYSMDIMKKELLTFPKLSSGIFQRYFFSFHPFTLSQGIDRFFSNQNIHFGFFAMKLCSISKWLRLTIFILLVCGDLIAQSRENLPLTLSADELLPATAEISPTFIPDSTLEPVPTFDPSPTLEPVPTSASAPTREPAPTTEPVPTLDPVPTTDPLPTPSNIDITVSTQGPDGNTLIAGRSFEWEIQTRWFGDTDSINPEIQKSPPFTGVEVQKQSTTLRTGVEGERRFVEKVFRYTLCPISEGEMTIGAATLRYSVSGNSQDKYLTTAPATFTVHPAPFSFLDWIAGLWQSEWFRIFVFSIIIIFVIGVTLWRWRRYTSSVPSEPVVEENPVEEAFQEAYRMQIEGDRSRFIRKLKQAVLLSLTRSFPEISSTELSDYRGCLTIELQMIFDRFVEQSEHIQFAPVSPSPDEMDRVKDDAKRLAGI